MIGIIDYNAGNITSVERALKSLNIDFILSKNPDDLRNCDKLIFPGVGDAVRRRHRERSRLGRPLVLAVSPRIGADAAGLGGLVAVRAVVRLGDGVAGRRLHLVAVRALELDLLSVEIVALHPARLRPHLGNPEAEHRRDVLLAVREENLVAVRRLGAPELRRGEDAVRRIRDLGAVRGDVVVRADELHADVAGPGIEKLRPVPGRDLPG